MKIYLYSFSKKRNSTAIPSGAGFEIEVKLKENCSVYHPAFILNHNAADFNYIRAVFPSSGGAFNTYYYFVDDITFNTDRIITANCSCDSLATLRSEILGTRANIMYTADSDETQVVDQRLPIRNYIDYTETKIDLSTTNSGGLVIKDLSTGFGGEPTIILGVTGKGSFGSYMLEDFYDLAEILDGCDNYMSGIFTDMLTGLKQIFYGGTASECLKSAIALPIEIDLTETGDPYGEQLFLGNYPCTDDQLNPIKVRYIRSQIKKGQYQLAIPWSSDAPANSWLRSSPYQEFILYFPFVGLIHLNPADLANARMIYIDYAINITSGDISIMVKGVHEETFPDKKVILATANGNMAINTAFGSTGIDTNRLTQSISTGLASAGAALAMTAAGNPAGAALTLAGGIGQAAGGAIAAAGGTGYGDGGLGGGSSSGLDKFIRLINVTRSLTATPAQWAQTYGKPFMKPDSVGNHSGLVITEGFSLSAAAPKDMIEEVNRLMDGGVYIE